MRKKTSRRLPYFQKSIEGDFCLQRNEISTDCGKYVICPFQYFYTLVRVQSFLDSLGNTTQLSSEKKRNKSCWTNRMGLYFLLGPWKIQITLAVELSLPGREMAIRNVSWVIYSVIPAKDAETVKLDRGIGKGVGLELTFKWAPPLLLEMVKDREAWHAIVHGIAKSQTLLSDWTITTPTPGASGGSANLGNKSCHADQALTRVLSLGYGKGDKSFHVRANSLTVDIQKWRNQERKSLGRGYVVKFLFVSFFLKSPLPASLPLHPLQKTDNFWINLHF